MGTHSMFEVATAAERHEDFTGRKRLSVGHRADDEYPCSGRSRQLGCRLRKQSSSDPTALHSTSAKQTPNHVLPSPDLSCHA